MQLYDKTAFSCSKVITNFYSTSFSLGIKMLDSTYHNAIYGIYAFVRYADEIVDTFHDADKELLLERFKKETYQSISEKISLNPVLQSYQIVTNQYKIPLELTEAFLKSMEMDLDIKKYENENDYNEYIYGSAEVVGLMCLCIFCNGNQPQYESLKGYARSLGAAFQKVNFLRDLKSDFEERGRVYFPGVSFTDFDHKAKIEIEKSIQKDFDDALIGIKKLPKGSKLGVYVAYIYYLMLFKKISLTSTQDVTQKRIRINDFQKITLLIKAYFKFKLNII